MSRRKRAPSSMDAVSGATERPCPHRSRVVTHGYEDIYSRSTPDAKIFQSGISPKVDKNQKRCLLISCLTRKQTMPTITRPYTRWGSSAPASMNTVGPGRASYASATGIAGRVIERSSTNARRRSARPYAPNPYMQAASRLPPDADLPRNTYGHPRSTRMAATSTRQDQDRRSSLQVGTG